MTELLTDTLGHIHGCINVFHLICSKLLVISHFFKFLARKDHRELLCSLLHKTFQIIARVRYDKIVVAVVLAELVEILLRLI